LGKRKGRVTAAAAGVVEYGEGRGEEVGSWHGSDEEDEEGFNGRKVGDDGELHVGLVISCWFGCGRNGTEVGRL